MARKRTRFESLKTTGSHRANLELDPAFCWQAVYSRDPRFDGRFFAGIASTGTYCRSTCPVSFGQPESVRWFQSAAAAEAAGYRPCRRCHPDTSPGSAAWFGTWAVVSRALKLISEGALDRGNLEQLAARVGMGSRHLRRLFQRHLGASPLKIARSHRVLVAKNLITSTRLPLAEVAAATGFRSVRQFNHSVRAAFGQSPSGLRRAHKTGREKDAAGGILVHLPYRPPFDWACLLRFLEDRLVPGVEFIENGTYRRAIEAGGVTGAIEVWHDPELERLIMRVLLPGCEGLMDVVQRARRFFDLGADAAQIGAHLSQDARLADLIAERPGIRVPGAWEPFEVAVVAALGQTLSNAGNSAHAAGQLAQAFGRPVEVSARGVARLFPSPAELAEANLEAIGLTAREAETVQGLARAVLSGALSFDSRNALREMPQLLRSMSLGDDAVAYVSMRALGDTDAFPCGEIEIQKGTGGRMGIVSRDDVSRIFDAYRPWRAYAAMHYSFSHGTQGRRAWALLPAMCNISGSTRRRRRASRRLQLRS